MRLSNLADRRNANQAPRQYPAAKHFLWPNWLRYSQSFPYFSVKPYTVRVSLMNWMILGGFTSPSQALSSSSGIQTLYPSEAQVSHTILCLPESMPKISSKMMRTRLPCPTWQALTPEMLSFFPTGWQLRVRAGQEPGGQHQTVPSWQQGLWAWGELELMQPMKVKLNSKCNSESRQNRQSPFEVVCYKIFSFEKDIQHFQIHHHFLSGFNQKYLDFVIKFLWVAELGQCRYLQQQDV